MLKRAIKERTDQLEALQALAPLALRWMQRSERLAGKVDEAFAREPFSRQWPAGDPRNIRRFRTYVSFLTEAFNLHVKACEAWMRAFGINPDDPAQWAEIEAQATAGSAVVPAGYRIAAYKPSGRTILLTRETDSSETTSTTSSPPLATGHTSEDSRELITKDRN